MFRVVYLVNKYIIFGAKYQSNAIEQTKCQKIMCGGSDMLY